MKTKAFKENGPIHGDYCKPFLELGQGFGKEAGPTPHPLSRLNKVYMDPMMGLSEVGQGTRCFFPGLWASSPFSFVEDEGGKIKTAPWGLYK